MEGRQQPSPDNLDIVIGQKHEVASRRAGEGACGNRNSGLGYSGYLGPFLPTVRRPLKAAGANCISGKNSILHPELLSDSCTVSYPASQLTKFYINKTISPHLGFVLTY